MSTEELSDADYKQQTLNAYQQNWANREPVTQRMITERRKADADFGDYLTDIPKGVVQGGLKFGQSVGDLATHLVGAEPIPEIQDSTKTWVGSLTSGVTEFAAAYAVPGGAATRIGRALAVGRGGKLALSLGAGGVADFVGFTGDGGRLSDLVEQHPVLSNPVSRFLSSKPDDTWAEKRLKGALEGLGLGAATEVLFHSLRGIRAANALERTKDPTLREYLERQIEESHASLNDAIGSMESAESATRSSRMLDVLTADEESAIARRSAVAERSTLGLEDGGRRVRPEGEPIRPQIENRVDATDVANAVNELKALSPHGDPFAASFSQDVIEKTLPRGADDVAILSKAGVLEKEGENAYRLNRPLTEEAINGKGANASPDAAAVRTPDTNPSQISPVPSLDSKVPPLSSSASDAAAPVFTPLNPSPGKAEALAKARWEKADPKTRFNILGGEGINKRDWAELTESQQAQVLEASAKLDAVKSGLPSSDVLPSSPNPKPFTGQVPEQLAPPTSDEVSKSKVIDLTNPGAPGTLQPPKTNPLADGPVETVKFIEGNNAINVVC